MPELSSCTSKLSVWGMPFSMVVCELCTCIVPKCSTPIPAMIKNIMYMTIRLSIKGTSAYLSIFGVKKSFMLCRSISFSLIFCSLVFDLVLALLQYLLPNGGFLHTPSLLYSQKESETPMAQRDLCRS